MDEINKLQEKLQQLKVVKDELNAKFTKENTIVESLIPYFNHGSASVSKGIFLTIPTRIRFTCESIYRSLEQHCGEKSECIIRQDELAKENGITREHVNYVVGLLHKYGLIEKVRRGLNKANRYFLPLRKVIKEHAASIANMEKEMAKLVSEIRRLNNSANKQNKKNKSTFNNYSQRTTGYDKVEAMLLGYEEYNPEERLDGSEEDLE
jgi:predicted transcriptional regulator